MLCASPLRMRSRTVIKAGVCVRDIRKCERVGLFKPRTYPIVYSIRSKRVSPQYESHVQMKKRIVGVLSPVVTPFKTSLSPDPERFVAHCRWLLSQDVGLAVFGTNSEANSLAVEEKMVLLSTLVESGVDVERLMPGTGCCALTDSVRLTSHAVRLGSGGVLMLPPFYYKGVTDEGLFRNFAEVIERVAFIAREDKKVDKRSGVSQRLPISVLENVVSNAERRALRAKDDVAVPRITDIYSALPSITGKLELAAAASGTFLSLCTLCLCGTGNPRWNTSTAYVTTGAAPEYFSYKRSSTIRRRRITAV